jgi:hypothetical protein
MAQALYERPNTHTRAWEYWATRLAKRGEMPPESSAPTRIRSFPVIELDSSLDPRPMAAGDPVSVTPFPCNRPRDNQTIFLAARIRLVDSPIENSNAIAHALSAEQSAVSKSKFHCNSLVKNRASCPRAAPRTAVAAVAAPTYL